MVSDNLHKIDNDRHMYADNTVSGRCEQHRKVLNDVEYSVEHSACRVILKGCEVGHKNTTLLGMVLNILPEGNVEVRLDDMKDTLIIGLDCILPVDAESAVVLANSFFNRGFKAASMQLVQSLCANYQSSQNSLLRVSDWLIKIGEHQEAETILRKALKLDPSVTSGDHLRALRALADLKSLLGLHDEAICLLEAVLQNDPDARSEHTASALLGLVRAYTELGEVAEASRIRSLLQRAADAESSAAEGTVPAPVA